MGGRHLCPLELLYTGGDLIDQRAKRGLPWVFCPTLILWGGLLIPSSDEGYTTPR